MGRAWIAVGILAGAAGCGRVGFDAGDAAPGDGAGPPAWDGSFTLTAPVPLTGVNSAFSETECSVSPDGTTLYFASNRDFDPGAHDIYAATRTDVDAPFAGATVLASMSSPDAEGRLVTADGLVAYYWKATLGSTDSNIFTVSRAAMDEVFAAANGGVVAGLDTTALEYDPWPSPDNRRLYLARGTDSLDLYVVDRPDDGTTFGAPQALEALNSAADEDNPAVSADQRFIVFSSSRAGNHDLYYARRASAAAAFDPPQPLPVVNTASAEWEACITERGELIFSSDRAGGMGDLDLYYARFIPAGGA